MAPTELLAEQHAINFARWLEPLGIKVGWLAGKQKGKAREEALARVRSEPTAPEPTAQAFRRFSARAQGHAEGWHSAHPMQIQKCTDLRTDMTALMAHLDTADLTTDQPWNRLWLWGEAHLSLEGQEQLLPVETGDSGRGRAGRSLCPLGAARKPARLGTWAPENISRS